MPGTFVSEEVARVLAQLSSWKGYLKDLGEAEVKHAVRIHLFNLYTEDLGNPVVPHRLRSGIPAKSNRPKMRRQMVFVILGTVTVAAVIVLGLYLGAHQGWLTGSSRTSTVSTTSRKMQELERNNSFYARGGQFLVHTTHSTGRDLGCCLGFLTGDSSERKNFTSHRGNLALPDLL